MKSFAYILACMVLFLSCKKQDEADQFDGKWDIYVLKKDSHYADLKSDQTVSDDMIKFKVVFDSTAIYSTKDTNNQADINKLYGFSDCDQDHHNSSARFGWRYYNKKLQLFGYCYKDAELKFLHIADVSMKSEYTCSIKCDEKFYTFNIKEINKTITMDRGCNMKGNKKIRLYPFFGGTEPSPHDITIKILDVKI